jgi:tRNA A37 threonylcarbamoyladenosine synthetase subunit TsaC/SUA5/YrdC
VTKSFSAGLDLILDSGSTPGGKPSTIVDLSRPSPRLVRSGPIALEAVVEAIREQTETQSLDGQSAKQLE